MGEKGERISVEKEIFDPALIAIRADIFGAIAQRVRRASFIFLGLRKLEKTEGFIFEFGHQLNRNTVVYQLEEPEFFTGFDDVGLSVGV